MPTFTDGIDVAVGDAILASHVDNLADNTEATRAWGDADHDWDISTGTGYHKCGEGAGKESLRLVAGDGVVYALGLYKPASGGVYLIGQTGAGPVVRATAEFAIPIYAVAELDVPLS